MRLSSFKEHAVFVAPVILALFSFFMPISATLKSVFWALSLVAIVLTPHYNQHIRFAFSTLWGRIATLFFIYIAIASLWSEAPYAMRIDLVNKYSKLICLPILAVGFIKVNTRAWCINAYLLSMIVTFIVSILKLKGFIAVGGSLVAADPGAVFSNHIITGFMMAFASYLCAVFIFGSCHKVDTPSGNEQAVSLFSKHACHRWFYIATFFICSYHVLFINNGRTGYAIYFILMILFLVQKVPLRKASYVLVILSALMLLVYSQSTVMRVGLDRFIHDLQQLQQHNQDTSIGYRVQFHHYAMSLFLKHPLIGGGTGSFKYQFSQDKPIPSWGDSLNDPHSQYWMILAEQGLIGLFLLGLFLASLLIAALKLTEAMPILLGIVVAFGMGSLSDTIFCYSTVGFLLILFSGLCLGELIARDKKPVVLY